MLGDSSRTQDSFGSFMAAVAAAEDRARVIGRFTALCRDADGRVLWEDEFDNLITTLGKNFLLDTALAGSSYTVTGPFMGLISSTSYSAVSASDTMASHSGWLEAGGANAPTMSSTRQTLTWSAASGGTKQTASSVTFTFTGSGTVQGGFVVLGSGAVNTVANTSGTLYAAGALGTAQPVVNGNTLQMTYQSTLT